MQCCCVCVSIGLGAWRAVHGRRRRSFFSPIACAAAAFCALRACTAFARRARVMRECDCTSGVRVRAQLAPRSTLAFVSRGRLRAVWRARASRRVRRARVDSFRARLVPMSRCANCRLAPRAAGWLVALCWAARFAIDGFLLVCARAPAHSNAEVDFPASQVNVDVAGRISERQLRDLRPLRRSRRGRAAELAMYVAAPRSSRLIDALGSAAA